MVDKKQRSSRTLAFSELVKDHMDCSPPVLPATTSCAEVVRVMREYASDVVLILDKDQRIKGIVTEQDIVRQLACLLPGKTPIIQIMSEPVYTVQSYDYLFHAIANMRRRGLRHMPAVDHQGHVVGLVYLHKALAASASQLMEQIDELTHEETLAGLQHVKRAQVEVAEALFEERVPVPEIQALLTQVNNDIYRRILELFIKEMEEGGWGQPPCMFCTIVMGSGGRRESFLFPDQDNGFILNEYPQDQHTLVDAFFIELASRMSHALNKVGIRYCSGHVMATNPLWRKTLSQWQQQIGYWLKQPHSNTLRLTDIFFDFKPVYGVLELGAMLREELTWRVKGQFGYLRQMQQVQDKHGVALGLFGRLVPDSTPGPNKGKLNLKYHGLLPLVEAIRLLALREGVSETSTLDRILALHNLGILSHDEQDYLAGAFQLITRLVLRQQLADFKEDLPVSTYVAPQTLSKREEDMLKDGLQAINALKQRVRTEFTGNIF